MIQYHKYLNSVLKHQSGNKQFKVKPIIIQLLLNLYNSHNMMINSKKARRNKKKNSNFKGNFVVSEFPLLKLKSNLSSGSSVNLSHTLEKLQLFAEKDLKKQLLISS